jgi:stage III sporulation protein SpoIIIAA
MSQPTPKAAKPRPRRVKSVDTYHGIRLADMSKNSQFTRAQVIKAVEEAIAKNPDVFARKP